MKRLVRFEIHGYWHAGTGRGAGPELGAVVARTPEGLPFVPGRTVKGLLRAAMELAEKAGAVPGGSAEHWFGTPLPPPKGSAEGERERTLEEMRFRTESGALVVDSAVLGKGDAAATWRAWAASHPAEVEALFRSFASTRIDESGVAAEHTLRAIEVAVPMTLLASVSGPSEPFEEVTWLDALAKSVPLIDGLGSHRNRGLGRVTVTVEGA
ncbi:MAG: hypothetical protein QME96_09965 [Myxococcota bacterium]|nr:hypothetical protein [Myxococcota bacterium]